MVGILHFLKVMTQHLAKCKSALKHSFFPLVSSSSGDVKLSRFLGGMEGGEKRVWLPAGGGRTKGKVRKRGRRKEKAGVSLLRLQSILFGLCIRLKRT